MIVAFDNTFLTLVINPNAIARPDPSTGEPVPHCRQRIDALIDSLSKRSGKVIVPAPSWAETLIASPDAQALVNAIKANDAIEIVSFDARSAYELAEMTRDAIANGDKRSGSTAEWQKVKFDRQIVAIAKAHGASKLYTDDDAQAHFARLCGVAVVHTWELELPKEYAQHDWVNDGKED